MSVERNDVDISQLFMWGKEFEIEGNNDSKLTVYIRLIGDADLNKARVHALRSSSYLRNRLKEKDSDERLAFVPEEGSIEREILVEAIAMLSTREYAQEAVKEVDIPYPIEPDSDAKLEKQEKYQAQVDAYPAKRDKKINEYIVKKVNERKVELNGLTDAELFGLYEGAIISELCENEMLKKFREFCTYSGIFNDSKYREKTFSSLEEFQNLPLAIKEKFMSAYSELEIEQSNLKKLPQATL